MRLSRILRFEVPVPEFTKNRFFRRVSRCRLCILETLTRSYPLAARRAFCPLPPEPLSLPAFFRLQKNALEGDRAKFYYWNLASLALTAVPLWYMASVRPIESGERLFFALCFRTPSGIRRLCGEGVSS